MGSFFVLSLCWTVGAWRQSTAYKSCRFYSARKNRSIANWNCLVCSHGIVAPIRTNGDWRLSYGPIHNWLWVSGKNIRYNNGWWQIGDYPGNYWSRLDNRHPPTYAWSRWPLAWRLPLDWYMAIFRINVIVRHSNLSDEWNFISGCLCSLNLCGQ